MPSGEPLLVLALGESSGSDLENETGRHSPGSLRPHRRSRVLRLLAFCLIALACGSCRTAPPLSLVALFALDGQTLETIDELRAR